MIVPIRNETSQQVGPPQEWAIGRRRPTEHDVVAAAGAAVLAIDLKFLGSQSRPISASYRPSVISFASSQSWQEDVHFDHAWVGCHLERFQPLGRAAEDSLRSPPGVRFATAVCSIERKQLHVIFQHAHRRHEDVQGAHRAVRCIAPSGPRRRVRLTKSGGCCSTMVLERSCRNSARSRITPRISKACWVPRPTRSACAALRTAATAASRSSCRAATSRADSKLRSGSESSGNRKPIGESPNQHQSRRAHRPGPLVQFAGLATKRE